MQHKCDKTYKLLNGVAVLSFIIEITIVPVGITSANLTSLMVKYAVKGRSNNVFKFSMYLLGLVVVYQLIYLALSIVKERLSAKAKQNFKTQVYNAFFTQNIAKVCGAGTGDYIENFTNDISEICKLFTVYMPSFMNGLLISLSYLIFIAINNSFLAIIFFVIGLLQVISPIIVERFMVQNYNNTREIEAKLTDYIIEGYNALSTIKLYNLFKYYMDGLCKIHRDYLKIGIKSEITAQGNNAMDNMVNVLLKFGTYAIVGWLIVKHIVTSEVGIGAIVLSGGLYSAMYTFFTSFPEIRVGKEAMHRINKLYIDEPNAKENCSIKEENNDVIIEVKDLSFNYETREILKGISFRIKKGEIILIEGVNGSGKSTMLNILLGLYDNYTGEIYVNGHNLKEINKDRYFDYISYLSQAEKGFSKSPEELISMIKTSEQIDSEILQDILKEFDLGEDILKNSSIKNLSGGEMKKVYLICALSKKSNLLFLDEPTNSLDASTRQRLKKIVNMCGKTVIIVSHDEVFREIADCFLKIHNGCIDVSRKEEYV